MLLKPQSTEDSNNHACLRALESSGPFLFAAQAVQLRSKGIVRLLRNFVLKFVSFIVEYTAQICDWPSLLRLNCCTVDLLGRNQEPTLLGLDTVYLPAGGRGLVGVAGARALTARLGAGSKFVALFFFFFFFILFSIGAVLCYDQN